MYLLTASDLRFFDLLTADTETQDAAHSHTDLLITAHIQTQTEHAHPLTDLLKTGPTQTQTQHIHSQTY
jgi:hypothetical protein